MTWYQILALVGVPSIVTAALNWIERRAIRKEKAKEKKDDRTDALLLGVQALLRAQMMNDFNHYDDKGYAPPLARKTFEDCWTQYKNLGGNGFMEDIHSKFFALPVRDKKGEDE